LLFSLSTDDVTFAVNGGRDQPFCGLMLNDRAVSHVVSGSYRPATGNNTDHQEKSVDQQILLIGHTELCH